MSNRIQIETLNASPKQVLSPVAHYSHAVIVSGARNVIVSGQTGINAQGVLADGVRNQTRQIFENIRDVLKECGADLKYIVKSTVLLTDINEFHLVDAVYREFFGEYKPARIAFQVVALPNNSLVEIGVEAVI